MNPEHHSRARNRVVFLVSGMSFVVVALTTCGSEETGSPPDDVATDVPLNRAPKDEPPKDEPPLDEPPQGDTLPDAPPATDLPDDEPPDDTDKSPNDPAEPPPEPLADLALSASRTANTFSVGWEYFPEGTCAYAEGCLQGIGWRRLLRFATEIQNVGEADLHLGNPETRPDLFVFDACHQHYHLLSSMEYRLFDASGNDLVPGYKQSFCWGDVERVSGVDGPDVPNYPLSDEGCNANQGLTRGWADVYEETLDCQFLDVTGVPSGIYSFSATVNGQGMLPESNYSNNSIELTVELPPSEGPPGN